MTDFSTEQESFWAGEFGTEYIDRNKSDVLKSANLALFSKILEATGPVSSAIEFGANIGLNMRALRALSPSIELTGVEINEEAWKELDSIEGVEAINGSALEFEPHRTWDLSFTKTVLIHINPDHLEQIYSRLYASSSRFICVAEYYNPAPVAIPYRGHTDRLFKRDFAGDLLDRYNDLRLVDYGFAYRRDPVFPQDDISWFLMEKKG